MYLNPSALTLVIFLALVVGGGLVYLWMTARTQAKEIAELREQVKGKRIGYHLANGIEDILAEDVANENYLVRASLYADELRRLLNAIDESLQAKMSVARAIRNGRYDPAKPAKEQQQ